MVNLEDIIKLRHTLHRYPELSNKEYETTHRISEYMKGLNPDKIIPVAGTGRMFVFEGEEKGETIVFRSELDALPIQEKSPNLAYRSSKKGISHLCGHDGHMAIMAYLGAKIAENRPKKGRAVLLFQPAEENELGAKSVVESPEFHALSPDYLFALHNIPGIPRNNILVKPGSFTAASCGLSISLEGHTSHAAEPELGLNPFEAANTIIDEIQHLQQDKDLFQNEIITTLIYIHLGEPTFGVSPGKLQMGITLRAMENEDLDLLCHKAEAIIHDKAEEAGLQHQFSYCEVYPATINAPECVEMVEEAATHTGLKLEAMDKPNKWSEDFAYYTATNKGVQFGIGAGEDMPPLHHPEYDFPDEIIEPATKLFYHIYEHRLQKQV